MLQFYVLVGSDLSAFPMSYILLSTSSLIGLIFVLINYKVFTSYSIFQFYSHICVVIWLSSFCLLCPIFFIKSRFHIEEREVQEFNIGVV